MKRCVWRRRPILNSGMILFIFSLYWALSAWPAAAGNANPPAKTVKLVFIHHSCGENWLTDGNGNLGRALAKNNYFVSDTNYGWGPHGIGDSTDITDWPRWFTGSERGVYLQALYRESGRHSGYTRTRRDPGGENNIIMFKSCFPNSNLEGRPGDAPRRGGGLTVANAKAVYNDLLTYFGSRPDKLFIAITAPPVQDRTHAVNARAFNRWLVNDWLKAYTGDNVAVFDFYNVLTGPGNHHRFRNGRIEHVVADSRNTLYYPSNGDDHPSPKGNRKATEEIVPLINLYYHRWQAGQEPVQSTGVPSVPEQTITQARTASSETVPAPIRIPRPVSAASAHLIDDFEQAVNEWVVFADEGNAATQLSCRREVSEDFRGQAGLAITYTVAPESWATCSLVLPGPQDWHTKRGISLYLRAEQAGQEFHIVAYQGASTDNLSHFEYKVLTAAETAAGWQRVDIPWENFTQPAWEGDGTAKFDPGRAMGLAFAFNGGEDGGRAGRIWVDDICFLSE